MLKFGCKESFDAWVDLIALVLNFADADLDGIIP